MVHVNSGIAALVCALVLRRRDGYGRVSTAPHSMMMTAIGTGMLWMGWFGFNAGSALEATGSAGRCVPDDALDTFGVHCIGGILGSLGTGFFVNPAFGGTGVYDYVAGKHGGDFDAGAQMIAQLQDMDITLLWGPRSWPS